MANKVIKLKLTLIKRIRIWWNNWTKNIESRLEYLDKIAKENLDDDNLR